MTTPAQLNLAAASKVLSFPARWIILRELAKEPSLPVEELSHRCHCSRPAISKHIKFLRAAGLVVPGFGRHYQLAPAYRPAPGAGFLDLGQCQIPLLDPTAKP